MEEKKILVSIFHKDGRHNDNFKKLSELFTNFDLYIPNVDFYGNKWKDVKDFFLSNEYESIFVICSDVSVVCGDIIGKIEKYGQTPGIGSYGFGTIKQTTYTWLRYNNVQNVKSVPFIEGYCFGASKDLIKSLELDSIYGYGLDLEMGYKSRLIGLRCIVDNEVCIKHEYGKSYDDGEAKKEYHSVLAQYPDLNNFLKSLNIYEPV